MSVNRIQETPGWVPQPKEADEAKRTPLEVDLTRDEAARRSELLLYGQQQRERIERLYGAGAAGLSAGGDARLARAMKEARAAYEIEYKAQYEALKRRNEAPMGPLQKGSARAEAAGPKPPKDMTEVAARAAEAYRAKLKEYGFVPLEVRGASVVKAADFLTGQAERPGGFTILSPEKLQAMLQRGETPRYFVRIIEKRYLESPDSRLADPRKPYAWMTTPEELAGAKLDAFEIMRRVGFSEDDIGWYRAKGKVGADFALAIVETDKTNGRTVPTWDEVIKTAKSMLPEYSRKPDEFWEKVKNLDYKRVSEELRELKIDSRSEEGDAKARFEEYAKSKGLESDVIRARKLIEDKVGANKYFTGDGRTARVDGRNDGYGVREFFIENDPVESLKPNVFVPLQERHLTQVEQVRRLPTIPENPLRLGRESRGGAVAGAVFSAATSLSQVFDRAQQDDYAGAAVTFAANVGVGTLVGGSSAAGERLIGDVAERALERTGSQLFSSTARQIVGRAVGSSVVGGLVNGGFAVHDQWENLQNPATRSKAIGTIAGEFGIGLGAGLAGAAAGAAIGSVIPVGGTIVGAVVGFAVGVGAGLLADMGLRAIGTDQVIANAVTSTIDNTSQAIASVSQTVSNGFNDAKKAVGDFVSNPVGKLASIFG